MSGTGAEFNNQILEGMNYITMPPAIEEAAHLLALQAKLNMWADLVVDMHVMDYKNTVRLGPGFYVAIQNFVEKLRTKNINLISMNMSDALFKEVKTLGLEGPFNRIVKFPDDLYKKKKLSETEVRRLLFKHLALGAFAAVEVALKSTVSCDENYSAKPEDVPLDQFDMITVVNIKSEILTAEFRLCSSAKVLERLASAMLGEQQKIDQELMESMALELLNMIYGYAKSNLNDKESFSLPAAIPRILRKPDFHRIRRSSAALLTIMPMITPMGPFYVEVDFGQVRQS